MRKTLSFILIAALPLLCLYFIPPTTVLLDAKNLFNILDRASRENNPPGVVVRNSPPDDYLWPTDASRRITSTFGEYRRTHFHAGVDISTNSATGYKVFSAKNGFVWRIGVSPTGYGKMLAVKHADGFITIYAHLKTFNNTINAMVRREQLRLERYPVEIALDSSIMPVTKGETIAYSGSSGRGPAHLHFEIRDESLNPLNPLLFPNLIVADSIPPGIRSIVLIPIDEYSIIAGKRQPLIVKEFTKQNANYHIDKKIEVRGKIGFGINAWDRINGTYHRVGVHCLELFLDDSLTYTAQLDRVPADEPKQVLMFYDLSLLRKKKGKFRKLFVEEGTSVSIVNHSLHGTGIIDANTINAGEHDFRIVCKDIQGNISEIRGALVTARRDDGTPIRSTMTATNGNPFDETPQDMFTIPASKAGWFSFDRRALRGVYDSGAVFQPLNIRVKKIQSKKITLYRFEPYDVLLNKGVRVFLRSPKTASQSAALYFRNNSRWEYLPTNFDSTSQYFSADLTYTLGEVALLEDTTAPQIVNVKITTSEKRPLIRCRVSDDRSGIDANEIKMYIDNDFVIAEIDGDRWDVRYKADKPLTKGKHTLRIVVKDTMKNTSTLTRTFFVTR